MPKAQEEDLYRIVGELYVHSRQSADASKKYIEELEQRVKNLMDERDQALKLLTTKKTDEPAPN